MNVLPLASDSMGVRSQSTFVETKDIRIIIDPGVALGPSRYGLSPHPLEFEKLEELTQVIKNYMKISDVLLITHYHYDHFMPGEPELHRNKILLIKHPKENINYSQQNRSRDFLEEIDELPKKIKYADGKEFNFNKTIVRFSDAVWHGPEKSKVGKVVMVSVYDGNEKLVYGSDAQGPLTDRQVNWIIKEDPDIVILDGPPTIFIGWRMGKWILDKSIENEIKILEKTKVKTMILDHHLVRDLHYKEKIKPVIEKARKLNKNLITAAELAGKTPNFLEARRKELYEKY